MVRLVKHGLEKFGFESIDNNDKSLSESQLDHEMVDRFVEVVVKVVLECRHGKGYCVVKEIDDELVEEVEVIHVGKRMMVLGWMSCASTLV
ncbi:hypothetical protein Tco_1264710 [Tanacetum coccineum]